MGSLFAGPDSPPAQSERVLAVASPLLSGPMAPQTLPQPDLSFLDIPESPHASLLEVTGPTELLPAALQDAAKAAQNVANQTLFGAEPSSPPQSRVSGFSRSRAMFTLGKENEGSPTKRPKVAEPSSSSSSCSMLPPPPGLNQSPFLPVLPDLTAFQTDPSWKKKSLLPKCPAAPKRISPHEIAIYGKTPCIQAIHNLRAKIAEGKPFPLTTSRGEVLFTIERTIDASMGEHSDVYIGFFVDQDSNRIRCALKLPKYSESFSPAAAINQITYQMILQANSESDKVLAPHMPTYYNFGDHPKAVRSIHSQKGFLAAKVYVQNQPELAYQLAEYVPHEFPAPEEGSPVNFADARWKQLETIIQRCVLMDLAHDLLPTNVRVRDDGTLVIIDNYEYDNADLTACRLRGHFINAWEFNEKDRERLIALVNKAVAERAALIAALKQENLQGALSKRSQEFLDEIRLAGGNLSFLATEEDQKDDFDEVPDSSFPQPIFMRRQALQHSLNSPQTPPRDLSFFPGLMAGLDSPQAPPSILQSDSLVDSQAVASRTLFGAAPSSPRQTRVPVFLGSRFARSMGKEAEGPNSPLTPPRDLSFFPGLMADLNSPQVSLSTPQSGSLMDSQTVANRTLFGAAPSSPPQTRVSGITLGEIEEAEKEDAESQDWFHTNTKKRES